MKRTSLTRSLILAGALAMAGASGLALANDDLAADTGSADTMVSGVHTETWFYPDGTSYTVSLTETPLYLASSDTLSTKGSDMSSGTLASSGTSMSMGDDMTTLHSTAMGAGPSEMSAMAMSPSGDAGDQVTQTWFFPDGTSRTVTWTGVHAGDDLSVAAITEPLL